MITGECFCGAIQYRVSGILRDARSCHCSRCRKAFSSQASSYPEVEPGEFAWIVGEKLLSAYFQYATVYEKIHDSPYRI